MASTLVQYRVKTELGDEAPEPHHAAAKAAAAEPPAAPAAAAEALQAPEPKRSRLDAAAEAPAAKAAAAEPPAAPAAAAEPLAGPTTGIFSPTLADLTNPFAYGAVAPALLKLPPPLPPPAFGPPPGDDASPQMSWNAADGTPGKAGWFLDGFTNVDPGLQALILKGDSQAKFKDVAAPAHTGPGNNKLYSRMVKHRLRQQYNRSFLRPASRSARNEDKAPEHIAITCAQDAAVKNSYFEIWLQEKRTWGNVTAWEDRCKVTESEESSTKKWVTIDRLIKIMQNKSVALDMAKVYTRDRKTWRTHPVVPHNLDALQVLADIDESKVSRSLDRNVHGTHFVAQLEHNAANIAASMYSGPQACGGESTLALQSSSSAHVQPLPLADAEAMLVNRGDIELRAKELAEEKAREAKRLAFEQAQIEKDEKKAGEQIEAAKRERRPPTASESV